MNSILTLILLFAGLIRKWILAIFNKEGRKYATARLFMMPLMQLLICLFSVTGALDYQYEISKEETTLRNVLQDEVVSGAAEMMFDYDTSTNDNIVVEALDKYKTVAVWLFVITIAASIFQIYATRNRKMAWYYALAASAFVILFDYYTVGVGIDFGRAYFANQQLVKGMEFLAGWGGFSNSLANLAYLNPIILTVCSYYYYKYLSSYYSASERDIRALTTDGRYKPIAPPQYKAVQVPQPVTPNATSQITKEYKACPICGEKILSIAIKCKHCGEWLNNEPEKKEGHITCPICGESIPADSIICPECKEPLK